MKKIVIGFVALLMLGACGTVGVVTGVTASDGNEEAVCNQQSEWARSGKVDGKEIYITCPGKTRPNL